MTEQNPTVAKILKRYDAKQESVQQIADTVGVSLGYVYEVLREHRPGRPRKQHKTRSDNPRMIVGLFDQGIKPAKIAKVLGVSRTYTYRELGKAGRV
ncbi:hypothetical protein ACQR1I_36270 [Bradyrhizobium sp. HKCCYLS2038]|uniref:hypothetical protein n=1 Tax=Bradyrhizobium sp. HKCCYLS2038 TaxID=3420764 RepID=UPI003EB965CD